MAFRAASGLALAVMTLAACGGPSGDGVTPQIPSAGSEAAEQAAADPSAPFFEPTLEKPNCPASVDVSKYPGAELAGVKLGMTRAEAVAAAYCDRKTYHVEAAASFFRLDTQGDKLGAQTVTMRNGTRAACNYSDTDRMLGNATCYSGDMVISDTTDTVHIATPGLPGQERVLGVWRSQSFKENPPTVEATVGSLIKRFGEPSQITDNSGLEITVAQIQAGESNGTIRLAWSQDVTGSQMTKTNPRMQDCANNIGYRYSGGQSWSSECGLTISAGVSRSSDNPAIATGYDVGMMNQQVMYQVGEVAVKFYADKKAAAKSQELERAKSAAGPDL